MPKTKVKKKNKYSLIVLVVVLLSCTVGYMWFQRQNMSKNEYYVTDREMRKITVGDRQLTVEVVTSPASLSLGLSGRDAIGADGMLFLFNKKRNVTFWMKEMNFNLDIIWIADNRVIGILQNVPKPESGTALTDLPVYSPEKAINAVLEIPAGDAKKLGIEIADEVKLPVLAP